MPSRSEYLNALLNAKKSNSQYGNVLVNPSSQQNTYNNVENTASTQANDNGQSWGSFDWLRQGLGYFRDFFGSIATGARKAFEGVGDFLLTGVSAIGEAAGADMSGLNNFISQDISTAMTNWEKAYNPMEALSNFGNSQYWSDMVSDYGKMFYDTNKVSEDESQYNKFKVQQTEASNVVNGLGESIGEMIPSIALGDFSGALGASAKVAKGISLAGFGLGAAGNSSETALNDGANAGQAFGYGAAEGAIEVGTELLSDGIGSVATNAVAKGSTNGFVKWLSDFGNDFGVAKKVLGGMTLSKLTKVALEEGTEEFESAMLEPLALSIYKGDQSSQYKDPNFWIDASKQFASGAALGLIMDSGTYYANVKMAGGKEHYSVLQDVQQNMESRDDVQSDYRNGKITYEEAQKEIAPFVENIKADYEKMTSWDDSSKKNFVDMMINPKSFEQTLNDIKESGDSSMKEEDIRSKAYAQTYDTIQKDLTTSFQDSVIKEINSVDSKAHIATEADLNQVDETTGKTLKELFDSGDNTVNKAYRLPNGTIAFNPKYSGEIASLASHEILGHDVLDMDMETRDSLLSDLKSNPKTNAKLTQFDNDIIKQYHSEIMKEIQSDYSTRKAWERSDSYGRKSIELSTDKFQSEQLANFIQREVTNLNDLERIAKGKSKSVLKSILEKAQGKLSSLNDAWIQNQLAKAIDTLNGKKYVTPTVSAASLSYSKKAQDITVSPNDIKELADYRKESHLSLASAKSIIGYEFDLIEDRLTNRDANTTITVNHEGIDDYANSLFKDGNLIVDNAELDGKIDSIVSEIEKAKVTVSGEAPTGNATITNTYALNQLLSKDDYDDFTKQMKADIKGLLTAKSETNKSNALYLAKMDILKLNGAIVNSLDKINRLQTSHQIYKEIKHLQQDFKSTRGEAFEVLDNDVASNVLKNMIGKANFKDDVFSATYKTFAHNLVESEAYKTVKNDLPFVQNSKLIFNSIEEIAKMYDKTLADEGKSQTPFTEEQLQTVNAYLNGIRKAYQDYKSGKLDEVKKSFANADTLLKVVNWNNPKQGISFALGKELAYASSPDVFFKNAFGEGSQTYDIIWNKPNEAYKQSLSDSIPFFNAWDKLSEDYKEAYKGMSKQMDFMGYKTTRGELMDLYIQSLVNTDDILAHGYDMQYGKHKLSASAIIHPTETDLANLSEIMTSDEKSMASKIIDIYDTQARTYKEKADEANGLPRNTTAGTYYPTNRSGSDRTDFENAVAGFLGTNTKSFANNKERLKSVSTPIKGRTVEARFNSYIDSLTKYGAMTNATITLDRFLNMKMAGSQETRLSYFNRNVPHFEEMYKYFHDQLMGRPQQYGIENGSKLTGNIVKAALFANPSVVLKQLASGPTILKEVSAKSWFNALSGIKNIANYNETVKYLSDQSGVLAERWRNDDVITSKTLHSYAKGISDILGLPIEKMDQAVIITLGWQSAQYEAEARNLGAFGTEANKKAAIKILEDIVLNTQSNAYALKMSPNRAGATGLARKVLSYFSSDLNNAINWWNEELVGKKQSDMRLKAYQNALDNGNLSEEERTAVSEAVMQEKYRYSGSNYTNALTKMAGSFIMKGLILALIQEFIDRLKGKKKWDEATLRDFEKTFALEATVNNLPFVSQIFNSVDYGREVSVLELTGINNVISLIKSAKEGAEKGWSNYRIRNLLLDMADGIGNLSGFPIHNIRSYTMSIWSQLDPDSGAAINSVLNGYTSTYAAKQFKEAITNGRTGSALGYLGYMMNFKVKSDDSINREIVRLEGSGFEAVPSDYATSYKDEDGNEKKFTDQQISDYKQAYDKAYEAVKTLISSSSYSSMGDKEKAKAITKVYSAYREYAMANATKSEPTSRLAKLLYSTNGSTGISKYSYYIGAISQMVATNSKTRVAQAIELLNKSSFSAGERYLVLYLAGFSLGDAAKSKAISYLERLGLSAANAKDFLGVK